MQQHEEGEREGIAPSHEADAIPGVRLLADDQTSKRLAKVNTLLFFKALDFWFCLTVLLSVCYTPFMAPSLLLLQWSSGLWMFIYMAIAFHPTQPSDCILLVMRSLCYQMVIPLLGANHSFLCFAILSKPTVLALPPYSSSLHPLPRPLPRPCSPMLPPLRLLQCMTIAPVYSASHCVYCNLSCIQNELTVTREIPHKL